MKPELVITPTPPKEEETKEEEEEETEEEKIARIARENLEKEKNKTNSSK